MIDQEPTKVCSRCHKEKFLWQFGKNAALSNGVTCACKECLATSADVRKNDITQRTKRYVTGRNSKFWSSL